MGQKYNILICLSKLGAGGIETACITQIKEFIRRGYRVWILAEEGIYSEKISNMKGVNFINFKYESRKSFNLEKVKKVEKIIEENNIKLVYINQVDCVTTVCSACILTNTPYIACVHHGITGVYETELQIGNISNNFLKLYYKMASKIVVIKESSQNYHMKKFGIEKQRYTIIPNCIDFNDFKTSRPIDINKVLLISRMEKDKGNGIIHGLKWFIEYKKLNSNAVLTICGSGSQENEVKKEVEKLNINCTMLGYKNNVKEIMEENGIVLGVGRCIQEAIALKRIPILTGNEEFIGSINFNNIEELAKMNFSGKPRQSANYKEVAKIVNEYNKNEIEDLVEKNYKWLYKNRNIANNLYEVKDINNLIKPIESLDKNEVIEILIGELQYMHTWMQREIDRGWDARDKTEEFYLNREKWSESELKEKSIQLEKLKKENDENIEKIRIKYEKTKERLNMIENSNSWKFLNKCRKLIKKK